MKKGELLRRFMKTGKNSVFECMIICAAIAATGSYYYYERHYTFFSKIQLVITGIIFLVWFLCALLCGKDRKLSFLIFTYSYWLIPYLYTTFYDTIPPKGYNKWLAFIDKIMEAWLKNPFRDAAKKLGTEPVTLAASLLMFVMLTYVFGNFIAYFYDRSYGKTDKIIKLEQDIEDGVIEISDEKPMNSSEMSLSEVLNLTEKRKKESEENEDDA